MSKNIEGFLFDLGNVLVDFNHFISAGKLSQLARLTEKEIYDLFFDSSLTEKFEEGKFTSREFYQEVNKLLGLNISYNRFVTIWNEIFFLTKKNTDCLELVKKLKENYKVGMISNINVLHFKYLKEKFDIFRHFDKVILSYEIGARKPKEKIYEAAAKFFKCPHREIIYTDDRLDLIEAGTKFGFNSFVFTSVSKFKSDIAKLGIFV
jgi:glucose-1-phosphatase